MNRTRIDCVDSWEQEHQKLFLLLIEKNNSCRFSSIDPVSRPGITVRPEASRDTIVQNPCVTVICILRVGHLSGTFYFGTSYVETIPAKPILAIDSRKTNLQLILSSLQYTLAECNFEGFEVTDGVPRKFMNYGVLNGKGRPTKDLIVI